MRSAGYSKEWYLAQNKAWCREDYGRWADQRDAMYDAPWYRLYTCVLRSFMNEYMPGHRRVLDAGGGSGTFARPLVEQGYDVTLLDISSDMARVAWQNYQRSQEGCFRVMVGDLDHLPLVDRSFDCVLCLGDPLCYCDYIQALTGFARILCQGGILIGGVASRLAEAVQTVRGGDLTHIDEELKTGDFVKRLKSPGKKKT